MGNKQRIEQAIIELFDIDRVVSAAIKRECPNLEDFINYPGAIDIALNLINMPPDNYGGISSEEEIKEAEKHRVLISWDGLYDEWHNLESGKEFLEMCYEWIKSYREKVEKFKRKKQKS